MDLCTAARASTRHADLLAEADAARRVGRQSTSLAAAARRAGEYLAGAFGDVRAARVAATAQRRSAAKS